MQIWTKEEINFLVGSLDLPTKTLYISFCTEFGMTRTYDSIQKKIKSLREAHSLIPDDEADTELEATYNELIQELPQSTDLKVPQELAAIKEQHKAEAKQWLEGIIALSEDLKQEITYHGSKNIVNSNKSTLCVLLSDNHFGKLTKYFDMEEARSRMRSIPLRIKEQPLPDIDEVVVILAGDMIEGEDIYPTQNSNLAHSAIEQVQVCSESIWQALLTFRQLFKCPVRVETVPGNHGRVSRTANEKTNWDNVIYHLLRVMSVMNKDPDLVVNCNFEEFRTFKVKDRIGLAYHHGVKHVGTPSMREKVAGWMHTKKFDFLVHGHWHEWHVGNWLGKFVIGNGCMCGPDDLAERMGQEDDARQAYFLITPGKEVWGFSFLQWDRELVEA